MDTPETSDFSAHDDSTNEENNDSIHASDPEAVSSTTSVYKCDQCDFESKKIGALTKHKWKHVTTKRYKCEQCEYRTNHTFHLKRHQLQHSDIKGFKCTECDYVTMKSNELKTHQLNNHGTDIVHENEM